MSGSVHASLAALAPADRAAVEAAAMALGKARRALFVTGAGLSADSGLPTYRGIGGLYDGRGTEDGVPIEEALSGPAFARHPERTWKYLLQVERACRGARPNRGHEALAALQDRVEQVVVLTQNVDGFHHRAGSRDVIEIHGELHALRCTACAWRARVADYAALAPLPRCATCGAVIRPDVVLFGEALPDAAFGRLERELQRGFDVVFAVGTSAMFSYIARPVLLARAAGHVTVEINPADTDLSDLVDHRVRARAALALEALWEAYRVVAPARTRLGR